LHRCAARHHRNTHELYSAKICYRHHPLYGVEVGVIRYLRRNSTAPVVIIRCPDRKQIAVPEWMLSPVACDRFSDEAQPRVAIGALLTLKRLLNDSAPATNEHDRAKSSTGGEHARQGRSSAKAVDASVPRRPDLGSVAGEHPHGLSGSVRRAGKGNTEATRPEGE
jgi:hypothetical protein